MISKYNVAFSVRILPATGLPAQYRLDVHRAAIDAASPFDVFKLLNSMGHPKSAGQTGVQVRVESIVVDSTQDECMDDSIDPPQLKPQYLPPQPQPKPKAKSKHP